VGVVDLEGGVGVVASRPALVAGPGDELPVALDDQCRPVDEVDDREVGELGIAEVRLGREEPAVDAVAGLAVVERGERGRVGRVHRADQHALAVPEHDRVRPALVDLRRFERRGRLAFGRHGVDDATGRR
jgi:hypothetical protein